MPKLPPHVLTYYYMDRKRGESQKNLFGEAEHEQGTNKPKQSPRLSKGPRHARTRATPESIPQIRVRSSAVVLERMKLTKEQMEEERMHWLEPLDSEDYKHRKHWQEKKKEAYFRARENALQRQATLSDMQWFVARSISRGKKNKDIEEELGVSINRINEIVGDIKRKAKVAEREDITRWFLGH